MSKKKLTREELINFISNATYGNTLIRKINYDPDEYKEAKSNLSDPCWEDVLAELLLTGKKIEVVYNKDYRGYIDLDKLLDAVHYYQIETGQSREDVVEYGDLCLADAILQRSLFGEEVFC